MPNKKTALPKECCFYFILLPEIHQCEGGHEEAVDGKAGQCGGIQEFQEPEDRGVGHYEGSDETYCQDAEVPHGEAADNLQEVVEAGQEHEGHRHDEGEVSACFSGNAKEKAAGNGAAAPREAWPEGETLEEADDEGLFRGNFIHIGNGEFLSLSHLFRHNHEDAAKHQTDDDGGGAEESMFDEAMEQEAHQAGRKHGNADIEYRGPFPAEPVMGIQDIGKFFMVHHQHRKDGTKLDKYVEKVCQGPFKAQHMAYNNHMACGGNRNVFRKPFYNAHNQSTEIFVHVNTSSGS